MKIKDLEIFTDAQADLSIYTSHMLSFGYCIFYCDMNA